MDRETYELTAELLELEEALCDQEREAEEGELNALINMTEQNYVGRLDALGKLIRILEIREQGKRMEAKRLTESAQVDANAVTRIKTSITESLKMLGMTRAKTSLFSFSVCNNGGKAPLDFSDDFTIDALPEPYRKVRVEPDTDALREALEGGMEIPFVRIGERGQHLRVK